MLIKPLAGSPRVSAAVPERAAQAQDGQPAEAPGAWGAAGGAGECGRTGSPGNLPWPSRQPREPPAPPRVHPESVPGTLPPAVGSVPAERSLPLSVLGCPLGAVPSPRPLGPGSLRAVPSVPRVTGVVSPPGRSEAVPCPRQGRAGGMDLAYVCEWEKKPKSNHCPSIPLVCAWSCRNLIAFTTDLRNEEEKGTAGPLGISPGSSRCSWETPGCEGPELCPAPDSSWLLLLLFLPPLSLWQCLTHVCSLGFGLFPVNQD